MKGKFTNGCPHGIREALDSPIPSLRTPFTPDGDMDLDGIRSQIDFVIAGGAKFIMQTWGDSMHSVLTDEEVALLAKVVIEHTAGRAKVIAADNGWATNKAVAYAEYCAEIGADILMLLPPDWAASTTPDTVVAHFNAAGAHMPLMLVTAFFTQSGVMGHRTEQFRMDVIGALYERTPALVAIKDDVCGEFGNELCAKTHDRWSFVSGGWMMNHFPTVPHGANGYLCTFMSFKPDVAWQYWNRLKAGDLEAAKLVVDEIETPLREHMTTAYVGGPNAVIHGMMELFGVCSRHLRLPYHTLTDDQLEKLKDFARGKGILSGAS